MTEYNKKLDVLFERWVSSYTKEDRDRFCKDGLMFKTNGNVDELWGKAERRVMFVLKDNPDGGQDTRSWLLDPKNQHLPNQFLQRLAEVFYVLLKLSSDEESRLVYKFSNVKNELHGKVEEVFNIQPFAFVEAKKLAGGGTVSSKAVTEAMTKDEKFFKEELEILRPNIIVCCDGENSQFDFITSHYFNEEPVKIEYAYPSFKDIQCCLWYYSNQKVAIIKSFHPGYVIEEWKFFEKIISPFHALLKRLK